MKGGMKGSKMKGSKMKGGSMKGGSMKGGSKMKGGKNGYGLFKTAKVKRDTQFHFTIDPFNLLLIGIIGFLMYQMMQKDLTIDNYVFHSGLSSDVSETNNYTDETNQEDIKTKPYRKNNEMLWDRYLEQRPPKANINIPTRGYPTDYESVGFLKGASGELQKLIGRETYRGSNLWNYFTLSSDYNQIPIPVQLDNKDCTDERGCSEIYDNQNVTIDGTEQTATIYNKQPYRYIP
jgi:hypothetical protein